MSPLVSIGNPDAQTLQADSNFYKHSSVWTITWPCSSGQTKIYMSIFLHSKRTCLP